MIDANTLLNPEYADAELRAYAFLSTQYARGVRSPLDCLQPFVVQAIAPYAGEQLEWKKVRAFLLEKYSLSVPYYMLERMAGRLREAGALSASEISGLLICRDARPTLSDEIDFSISEIDQVGQALASFAQRRQLEAPLTSTTWNELIIPFFLHRSPPNNKAAAKVKGVLVRARLRRIPNAALA